MKIFTKALALALISALVSTPVAAHHSHAMFDHDSEVQLSGTVSDFRFANPHGYIYIEVTSEEGNAELWAVELSNMTNMLARGINRNTYQAGDKVSLTVYPLRNGVPGGSIIANQSIFRDGLETWEPQAD
jgi:hypothetical protein